jgi:hypothetical protein
MIFNNHEKWEEQTFSILFPEETDLEVKPDLFNRM